MALSAEMDVLADLCPQAKLDLKFWPRETKADLAR